MGHTRNKLTTKQIDSLPPSSYGDGGGLWLRLRDKKKGQWLYRFRLNGKARQIGLGAYPKITLAEARLERNECEAKVKKGLDPKVQRQIHRADLRSQTMTFEEVARSAFEAHKASLRDGGKAGRWFGPIERHILPKLGTLPVTELTQFHLQLALSPIWHSKADTARKAVNRLSIIFRHAAAQNLKVDVSILDNAKELLGKRDSKPQNIPAMPWKEVPEFYASLTERTPSNIALKFLILNPGARSKPVRYLNENHIVGNVWTIPGDLMKGIKGKEKDWKTPLTPESLELLDQLRPFVRHGNYFPNVSGRGVMSDATMSRLMERMGLEYRPHGFRASFRTWAEENSKDRGLAELCLAHKFYGDVEAAYIRTDKLEQRRALMQDWSNFVASKNS